jgi:biopolymer transport protein TolQ
VENRGTVWIRLVTAEASSGTQDGVGDILLGATGVVLGVIIVLVVLSFVSGMIIFYKALFLYKAKQETAQFLDVFWKSKRLDAIYQAADEYPGSPVSHVFKAGFVELTKLKNVEQDASDTMQMQLGGIENVERSLRRAMSEEVIRLESRLPFLATVGSNAVFIGLFGTVWGIMVSFVKISQEKAAGIDVVAGPIAEALIVTAVGLVTAIPAGVAYNLFLSRIRVLASEMENFSNDFLNIVKRHFFQ